MHVSTSFRCGIIGRSKIVDVSKTKKKCNTAYRAGARDFSVRGWCKNQSAFLTLSLCCTSQFLYLTIHCHTSSLRCSFPAVCAFYSIQRLYKSKDICLQQMVLFCIFGFWLQMSSACLCNIVNQVCNSLPTPACVNLVTMT